MRGEKILHRYCKISFIQYFSNAWNFNYISRLFALFAVFFSPTSGNVWTTTSLFEARADIASTTVGNTCFFAGGINNASSSSSVVDIFDFDTGNWSKKFLSVSRTLVTAGSVLDIALFASGFDYRTNAASTVVDVYNITSASWKVYNISVGRGLFASATVQNQVLFAGGRNLATGDVYSVVDIFDATTSTWKNASLSVGRASLAAASVGSNAYFIGGWSTTIDFH